MHTTFPLDECRKCSMYLNETKDFVSCGRLKDYPVLAHVMPLYDFDKEKMIKVVFCGLRPEEKM